MKLLGGLLSLVGVLMLASGAVIGVVAVVAEMQWMMQGAILFVAGLAGIGAGNRLQGLSVFGRKKDCS